MTIKTILSAGIVGAALAAAPATAKTFDIATAFQTGNPLFSYGSVSTTGVVTPFAVSDCTGIGVSGLCYRGTETYQIVAQRNGVSTSLLVHPSPDLSLNSGVFFTAPRTGVYSFNGTFTSDNTGDGVGILAALPNAAFQIAGISPANPTIGVGISTFLTAGQKFGFAVNNGTGSYYGDSTFVAGAFTGAVPEPATWALMILGFGTIGYAMRRRRSAVRTTVRYA